MRVAARQLVAAVYSFIMILPSSWGESFFLKRDHRDQGDYYTEIEYKVKSMEEAEEQLEKYGYMKGCHIRRARRTSGPSGLFNIRELDDDKRNDCSPDKVKASFLTYQMRFGLPETGRLDEATRKFMNTRRCGNSDDGELVNAKFTKQPDFSAMTTPTTPEAVTPKARTRRSAEFVEMPREATPSVRTKSLFKKIFPQASQNPLKRRRKIMQEILEDLQSGRPSDTIARTKKDLVRIVRKRRSAVVNEQRRGEIFHKNIVRWRLLQDDYSKKMPIAKQIATLKLAFRMWSEVIPLHFVLDTTSDVSLIDVQIRFETGQHNGCDHRFDGTGGELAHSWFTGDIHIDDDENFTENNVGLSLLKIAVHEIGHVLGLGHTTERTYSIMFPVYEPSSEAEKDFEIGWEDRKTIQKIYGPCRGKFDTIFDWVRQLPDDSMVYNSYFFRDGIYWMYENSANRTRYGDPLVVGSNWKGLPDKVDGYAHVFIPGGTEYVNNQYFFSGENYYLYDSTADKVAGGWPRKIAQDFGPKPGSSERVPDNIDSVYFDFRDQNYYFFKGQWVYVFKPGSGGCCERKRKISEEFPALTPDDQLPDNLDAVYFSFKYKSVFYVKDEDTYQNVYFSFSGQVENGVKKVGKWWNQWYDICEV